MKKLSHVAGTLFVACDQVGNRPTRLGSCYNLFRFNLPSCCGTTRLQFSLLGQNSIFSCTWACKHRQPLLHVHKRTTQHLHNQQTLFQALFGESCKKNNSAQIDTQHAPTRHNYPCNATDVALWRVKTDLWQTDSDAKHTLNKKWFWQRKKHYLLS